MLQVFAHIWAISALSVDVGVMQGGQLKELIVRKGIPTDFALFLLINEYWPRKERLTLSKLILVVTIRPNI